MDKHGPIYSANKSVAPVSAKKLLRSQFAGSTPGTPGPPRTHYKTAKIAQGLLEIIVFIDLCEMTLNLFKV
jgi:hypothetical protein